MEQSLVPREKGGYSNSYSDYTVEYPIENMPDMVRTINNLNLWNSSNTNYQGFKKSFMLYLLDGYYSCHFIQSVLDEIQDRYLLLFIELVKDAENNPNKQEQLIEIRAKIDRSLDGNDFSNKVPEMVIRILNQ